MSRFEVDVTKSDRGLLTFVFFILCYVVVFFLAAKLEIVQGRHLLAVFGSGVASWAFQRHLRLYAGTADRLPPTDRLLSLGVVALAGTALFLITRIGYVMAGHDPIIVPTLADSILAHATTMDVYRPGDPGFTYPPGYPILFSIINLLLPAATAVFLFKLLSIGLILALPIGWAWMAKRIFRIPLPFWLLLSLSYLATYGLERTAIFTMEHGKNSQVLAGNILPYLIAILLVCSQRWPSIVLSALAMLGGILVHYSIIYMLATFLAGYALIHFPRRREEWLSVLRLGISGVLSLGLFVLLMKAAFQDPRAGGFGGGDLSGGLQRMAAMLSGDLDVILFILNELGGDILHFHYRGLVLIACVLLPLAVGALLRGREADPFAVARMAAVWGIMVLLEIAFASGIVQVGMTPDFVRWQMIFPQAALLFTGLCAIACYARSGMAGAKAAYAGGAAVTVLCGYFMVHDFTHIAKVFQAHRLQRSQLTEMRDVLAGHSPCFLITDSFTIADGLHTVQRYRPLEYAEIMTGCRILNGSFVQRGAEGGRAVDGLPDAALLASLPVDATVLLIVPEPVEARYRSALPKVAFEPYDGRVGPLPIWKLRLR